MDAVFDPSVFAAARAEIAVAQSAASQAVSTIAAVRERLKRQHGVLR